MRHLRSNRRGVSNVIVVMLSLVLVVIIVGNVVLWSYQMNQLDWEKMQEKIAITGVEHMTHSSWFTSQNEYTINAGNRSNGTYLDTQTVDDNYETFVENSILDVTGEVTLDMATYPPTYTQSVEIQIHYRANDSLENWFLRAYNWTSGQYSNVGFNATGGDTPTSGFNYYAVNLTNTWQSYVQNSSMRIKLCDNSPDANRTSVDVDFLGARLAVDGTKLSLENTGSSTVHVTAIWVITATQHRRYSTDFFLNSGAKGNYLRNDISPPISNFTVRIVTERGNTAIFRID